MQNATPPAMPSARGDTFRRRLRNPALQRSFLFAKLPLGWFAGLRVRHLDAARCEVSIPRGWRTQNPFRSIYFAAQCMAAELSTGALAMAAVEDADAPVSMLVTGMRGEFGKKAVADAVFVCDDGARIAAAVRETIRTGEGVTVDALSVGRMADGTEVARFIFTWSFRRRAPRE